jgi:Zn-dependent protease with chaperone function
VHLAVYLPLLLSLPAALAARAVADRLPPRPATWLLTVAAVVLAGASTAMLGLLTLSGLVRIPLLAKLGDWSLLVVRRDDPAALSVSMLAGVLLTAAAVAAGRVVHRRIRALVAATGEAACLPGTDQLVVVDDPAAEAFAIPGLPGRIVVSTGMLAALDPAERQVLLAHERVHLSSHHYLFTAVAQLAAAANPLLLPIARAVGYTVERWADEHAATVTGDRRRVARTVGKAALAADRTRDHAGGRLPAAALGLLGRFGGRAQHDPLRGAGPVPRRVAALLAPPPRHRPLPLVGVTALLFGIGLCAVEAMHDLNELLELARR